MSLGVPAAIVLAGLVIAGAIFFRSPSSVSTDSQTAMMGLVAKDVETLSADDRLIGSMNAPIKIIEYSDLECPFCKAFHRAAAQVMEKYKAGGELAWIFRHFPLDSLHSKARAEAIAAECARVQGGDEAFFAYIDRVFTITPSNNGLDLGELAKIAGELKLDLAAFEACRESEAPAAVVESHLKNALTIGADGTPFVILADGDKYYPLFKTGIPAEGSDLAKAVGAELTTLFQAEIAKLRAGN